MNYPRITHAFMLAGVSAVLAACSGQSASLPTTTQNASHSSKPIGTMSAAHKVATSGYSLFGDANLVHPGYNSPTAAQATSTSTNGFGGVDFSFPSGLTLSQLTTLSSEFQMTAGDCGLGSPRLVATVMNGATTGNVNFYFGPPPNYTGCTPNTWTSTGNLAAPTNLVDDSQLPGGTFYDAYANAQAKYGAYTVTDIFVVVDGSSQTAQFDNVQINNKTYTFESENSCKNGGWQLFTSSPGPFANQGQCVEYFANGGT